MKKAAFSNCLPATPLMWVIRQGAEYVGDAANGITNYAQLPGERPSTDIALGGEASTKVLDYSLVNLRLGLNRSHLNLTCISTTYLIRGHGHIRHRSQHLAIKIYSIERERLVRERVFQF